MALDESKPSEFPEPEGYCGICKKEAPECVGVRHICEACHADGWREGAEMMQAFRDDPQLGIDDNGKVTVVPDYKKKWADGEAPSKRKEVI